MNGTAFVLMNHAVTWAGAIAAVAIVQWLVFAMMSLLSKPVKVPLKGKPAPRKIDGRLIAGSLVFAALSFVAFDGMALVRWKASPDVSEASAVAARPSRASCAVVAPEMTAAQLEAKLGKPDEIRPNEDVRGPGATLWIYRDSRCAVALFDGVVEMTE